MSSQSPVLPRWRAALSALVATLLVALAVSVPATAHADDTAIDISFASVRAIPSTSTFTGSAIEPEVEVIAETRVLIEGTDFTKTYSTNINAGIGIVTVMGIGSYTGTATGTFAIGAAALTEATVTGVNTSYPYTGSAITPTAVLTVNGQELIEDTDYTVTYSSNQQIGTASIQFNGIGNYSGALNKTFSIVPASLEDALIVQLRNAYLYTGAPIEPEFGVTLNGSTLLPGTHFTQSYSNNVELGIGTITITGINRFSGTVSSTFEIVDRLYTPAEVLGMLDQLPVPVATLAAADDVAALTNAVATLSGEDYSSMPANTTQRILDAQKQARQVNQPTQDVDVSAVSAELTASWSVRLVATPRTEAGSPAFFEQYKTLFATSGQAPVALYELSFIDTMTGEAWNPSEPVTISFTGVDLTGWTNPIVVHQKSDGTFETLTTTINEKGVISFLAPSFSLFGVVADLKQDPAPVPEAGTGSNSVKTPQTLAKTGGVENQNLILGAAVSLLLLSAACVALAQRGRRAAQ